MIGPLALIIFDLLVVSYFMISLITFLSMFHLNLFSYFSFYEQFYLN